MLSRNKFGFIERKPAASSSAVKRLPLNTNDKNCAAVPQFRNDTKQNTPENHKRKREEDDELHSCSKKTLLINPVCDENNIDLDAIDSVNSKGCTVFRNWYLLISIEGDLLIEGNVKCNIVTRSYPVVKRLTNTKVLSMYKRIYILDGPIVERCKHYVPEYVRRKFRNGFPNDWENVHRLWIKYLDKNGKNFRWPTITSDNDVTVPSPPSPFTTKINNKKLIKNSSEQYIQNQLRKLCSPSKKTTLNNSITCNENSTNIKNSDFTDIKGSKNFSHWRVLMDDEGQLIIEGTLESGKIERSKQIMHRLTNKKLLCINRWIYILDGTLVNNRDDLPDYVRWKFHNGFPVEWKNVYQHWKNYLAKKSKSPSKRLLNNRQ